MGVHTSLLCVSLPFPFCAHSATWRPVLAGVYYLGSVSCVSELYGTSPLALPNSPRVGGNKPKRLSYKQ